MMKSRKKVERIFKNREEMIEIIMKVDKTMQQNIKNWG